MSPATTTRPAGANTAGDWPPTTSPWAATPSRGSPRAGTEDTAAGGDASSIVDARMASMPGRDATMRDLVATLLSAAVTEIVEREWERYLVHRGQWRHAWKRLHRKKMRRWLR